MLVFGGSEPLPSSAPRTILAVAAPRYVAPLDRVLEARLVFVRCTVCQPDLSTVRAVSAPRRCLYPCVSWERTALVGFAVGATLTSSTVVFTCEVVCPGADYLSNICCTQCRPIIIRLLCPAHSSHSLASFLVNMLRTPWVCMGFEVSAFGHSLCRAGPTRCLPLPLM